MLIFRNKQGLLNNDNGPSIIDNGNIYYFFNGTPFRKGNKATFIVNGDQYFFRNGILRNSRKNPSIIYNNNDKDYYFNGYKYKSVTSVSTNYYDKDGLLHRNNGPAFIHKKNIEYYYHGDIHRVDGPARILIDDFGINEFWYYKSVLHRSGDKPAIKRASGDIYYYVNGMLHRDNDQPAQILSDGSKKWYTKGKLHRGNDKPAIEMGNGDRFWFQNNLRHRENGKPAVILKNGKKEYYYHDTLSFLNLIID
jgi:hypothetical protein